MDMSVDMGPSPYDSDIEKARLKDMRRKDEALLKYLRIDWRGADNAALQFRYINRRFIRPEMTKVMTARELVEVRGGLGYIDENRMHDTIPRAKNDVYEMLPHDSKTLVGTEGGGESSDQLDLSTKPVIAEGKEVILEMKMTFIRSIIGSGLDIHGNTIIPIWAVDPYPMKQEGQDKSEKDLYPMSKHLFAWIASRLHLGPVHKISPAVPSEEHFTLQFNRKYDEEVVFLKDGSLVVVNVLFGVFLDGQLGSDSEHGCPSSANKYCNINEVNKLIPGLTVSVYDIRSDVMKAVKLFDKGLARFADILQTAADDYPLISQKFIRLCHIIIRLDRVGNLCSAVTLDPSGLQVVNDDFIERDLNADPDLKDKFRFVGVREEVSSNRRSRIALAVAKNKAL
jgi:hypothetical protein